jgi:hypothetical protein
MTNRLYRLGLVGVCAVGLGAFGCTSSQTALQKKQMQQAKAESKPGGLLPRSSRKILKKRYHKKMPDGIQTLAVKKGIPITLYLHPKSLLSEKPFMAKNWINRPLLKGRSRSWYIKLDPRPGAKLGRYVFVRSIMAVWTDAGGFRSTSRVSAQFLLRRGKKETLLFSSMQLPKGKRYQAYDITEREINYNNESERIIKKGDILIFRIKHRSGNGGVVALGGGLGVRGSFFVITQQRSDYYKYTK